MDDVELAVLMHQKAALDREISFFEYAKSRLEKFGAKTAGDLPLSEQVIIAQKLRELRSGPTGAA